MGYNYKTMGRIHSLNGKLKEVVVLENKGNNNYVVEYDGEQCTAVFNFFTNCFYVDDVYGVIKRQKER